MWPPGKSFVFLPNPSRVTPRVEGIAIAIYHFLRFILKGGQGSRKSIFFKEFSSTVKVPGKQR